MYTNTVIFISTAHFRKSGEFMENDEFEELLRIQRLVTDRLSVEAKMDRKIKLLDLISSMVSGRDRSVQKEIILYESSMEGYTEDDTERLLQDLVADHFIRINDGKVYMT